MIGRGFSFSLETSLDGAPHLDNSKSASSIEFVTEAALWGLSLFGITTAMIMKMPARANKKVMNFASRLVKR